MLGRRVPDNTEWSKYVEGDYGKNSDGTWCCYPPNGNLGSLIKHDIIEHEDGTITVSPSILQHGQHEWHGFLEKGIWRQV